MTIDWQGLHMLFVAAAPELSGCRHRSRTGVHYAGYKFHAAKHLHRNSPAAVSAMANHEPDLANNVLFFCNVVIFPQFHGNETCFDAR
jgi:hypothetical protein